MKLTKTDKGQVSEVKEVSGLLACLIEYEIKSAKGRLEYAGPKFAPDMWHQVMSFFRWTYQEMQSESQVRLYVNTKLGRWGAWAFPQEARTGISARELPIQETPEQARVRFACWNSEPSDDWLYFGTVHHHCSLSAFQSGTDEKNERNQDGLHITVGVMDSDRHDMHARFYIGGNCFEPAMNLFWPIDLDLARRIPPGMLNDLARFQMCERVTVDFPEAWKANVMEVKRDENSHVLTSDDPWESSRREMEIPWSFRLEEALEEISRRCAHLSIHEEQWLAILQKFCASDTNHIFVEACLKYGVTLDELLKEVTELSFEF